jgi:hypothetical protein
MYTVKLYACSQLLLFHGEIGHITPPRSQKTSIELEVNDGQE